MHSCTYAICSEQLANGEILKASPVNSLIMQKHHAVIMLPWVADGRHAEAWMHVTGQHYEITRYFEDAFEVLPTLPEVPPTFGKIGGTSKSRRLQMHLCLMI